MFFGYGQACPTFSEITAPISLERVELFCLFVALSYAPMEATVLHHVVSVGYGQTCLKFSEITNHQ